MQDIAEMLRAQLRYPEATNLQQRGIADKIEDACNEILLREYPDTVPARSRRSIEDISIGNAYLDHKTTDVSLDFKMPNLISIDRLIKLDRPLFYNFVTYDSIKHEIIDVMVLNVFQLNWAHLKIQNLGVGQLQISNMRKFLKDPMSDLSKEAWLKELRSNAIKFYDSLISKTQKRRAQWEKL